MVYVALWIDESEPPHPTLSNNIASFRSIDCAFDYGDLRSPRSFNLRKGWPNHGGRREPTHSLSNTDRSRGKRFLTGRVSTGRTAVLEMRGS